MKKEIQSQIKDAVISIFIDKIISLSRIVDRLKEENENLRNSLISTLKNVFVVKNVMNIHGSINKVYSLQQYKLIDILELNQVEGMFLKNPNIDNHNQKILLKFFHAY